MAAKLEIGFVGGDLLLKENNVKGRGGAAFEGGGGY